MDRKAIIVVTVSVGFIIVWTMVIVPKFLTKPLPPGAANAITTLATNLPAQAAATRPSTPALITSVTTAPAMPFVAPSVSEETLTLTNATSRFIFTSHGGGMKRIELLGYPESVAHGKQADTNRFATLNANAAVPVLALLGEPALLGDGVFTLTRTAHGVRAEKVLTNGLVVVKEFQPTSNFLFQATVQIENSSDAAVTLGAQELVIGTATPMNALDKEAATTVGLMWSDGEKNTDILKTWFDNTSFAGCISGHQEPRSLYRGGANNVVWVAVHNQFFALAAVPSTNAPEVLARLVELPKPALADLPENSAPPLACVGFQTVLNYPGLTLAPGAAFERRLTFYAGPKEYSTLAQNALQQGNNLDGLMGFGFFGFVSKALLSSMNWVHNTLGFSYGLAIIAITFIIKLVFWPLTRASTRSMKRMQALQPQMKLLQEKFKGDPAKLNKKMMEFWKEHKVSPMGGCLPMVLQIPVFFGFFSMIRSAIELRGAHFLWVHDLSLPDTLFTVQGFPINLLPLIMGATMLWQAQLTPPSPGMDPAQQKIMKYMPLMFMVFLYSYSSALTLYWTTQNLLTILQTKLTKTENAAALVPAVAAPTKRK